MRFRTSRTYQSSEVDLVLALSLDKLDHVIWGPKQLREVDQS